MLGGGRVLSQNGCQSLLVECNLYGRMLKWPRSGVQSSAEEGSYLVIEVRQSGECYNEELDTVE